MITETQSQVMDCILSLENVDEFIGHMIVEFAKGKPEKIPALIKMNNDLIAETSRKLEAEKVKAQYALTLEVYDIVYKRGKKKFKINNDLEFITAIHACRSLYPDGDIQHESELGKIYFNAMLGYLKEHLSEYLDDDWSKLYGFNDYIKMIIAQDSNK